MDRGLATATHFRVSQTADRGRRHTVCVQAQACGAYFFFLFEFLKFFSHYFYVSCGRAAKVSGYSN
jgi:hypothetical protein